MNWIVDFNEPVLVTGAAGFIGNRVVNTLLHLGFQNVRCFVKHSSDLNALMAVLNNYAANRHEIIVGNLMSQKDCAHAVEGVKVAYHLVTGRGKSFPGCFQNSVVTTRNLLEATIAEKRLLRFVNVSSFAVYSNIGLRRRSKFDETCRLEDNLDERCDAYVYAKLKQDELVQQYHERHEIPIVTVRPCVVFGPGKKAIPGVVGLDTFGVFFHLGGRNKLPLTYVDNCADAIVQAGLVEGIDGQIYNIVDDDLPTSRYFLRRFKKAVGHFRSIPMPYPLFYSFCAFWEYYSRRSEGQLPSIFNRRFCSFHWKGHRYSNQKIKKELGWQPNIPMDKALQLYFNFMRNGRNENA